MVAKNKYTTPKSIMNAMIVENSLGTFNFINFPFVIKLTKGLSTNVKNNEKSKYRAIILKYQSKNKANTAPRLYQ